MHSPLQSQKRIQIYIREEFYRNLSEISQKIEKSRHMLVTSGDFNAKTGSGYKTFPNNMGRHDMILKCELCLTF